MRDQALFDKIDLHLIRVLHTVLTERSVSRAAVRLGMHQPAVSAALKRLRDLAGDPLLVRSGASMMPTDAALRMVEPAALILRSAEALFSDARGFDPRTATRTFRVAASDYLDPLFLPQLVARIKALVRRTNPSMEGNKLVAGDLELDTDKKLAIRAGQTIVLTAKEYSLLEYLLLNKGKVVSRQQIAADVWDIHFDTGTNVVDVYVNFLRKKVDRDFEPKLLHTQIGMGYMIDA